MAGNFQKKTGGFLVSALIGLIIISFMFTGYETMQGGTPDSVATVGDHSIKYREFRAAYERQVQMYSQFMNGGKPLSQDQIKSMNISKQVVKSLVDRKLLLSLAAKIGVEPSEQAVKKDIKELPYFKTAEKFDINRYKAILANARISPQEFEEDIRGQRMAKELDSFLNEYPLSNSYLEDLIAWKKQGVKVSAVRVARGTLEKYVRVTSSEVKKFLANKDNLERVEGRFKARKSGLDQKEEVKARHILLTAKDAKGDLEKKAKDLRKKLTKRNFAKMADKHSQDPGNDRAGEKQGGSLGWFGKGRMVPEFEKAAFTMKKGEISQPVKTNYGYHIIYVEDKKAAKEATLNEHKDSIAKEIIRSEKKEDLDKLYAKVVAEAKAALKSNRESKLKRLNEKYEVTFQYNQLLNKVDGKVPGFNFEPAQIKQIFADKGKVLEFATGATTNVVISDEPTKKMVDGLKLDKESVKSSEALNYSRRLRKEMVDKIRDEVKVSINPQLI